MTQKKNEFLQDLAVDCAVLHNRHMKNALLFKNLHDIVLGAKNALDSGAYDDLSFEDFKQMIQKDLEDIYNKGV